MHTDGHQFIENAVESALPAAIICEQMPSSLNEGYYLCTGRKQCGSAGFMAHNFFGQPSEKLKLVGVTGTNGKTTIATLLYKLFTALGYKCGLLSTVENHIGDKHCLQHILHRMPFSLNATAETNG